MLAVSERLAQIDKQIGRAVAAVVGDREASPVLAAVVKELHRRSQEALRAVQEAEASSVVLAIHCLAQAGRCAMTAAEADEGASDATRKAIGDAHAAAIRLADEQ